MFYATTYDDRGIPHTNELFVFSPGIINEKKDVYGMYAPPSHFSAVEAEQRNTLNLPQSGVFNFFNQCL